MSGGPNVILTEEQYRKQREAEAARGQARKNETLDKAAAVEAAKTPEQRYNQINAPINMTYDQAVENSKPKEAAIRDEAFNLKDAEKLRNDALKQEQAQRAQEAKAAQQQQEARGQQSTFISQLQERAAGSDNTAAQKALREGARRAQAQRDAIAASQGNTTASSLRGQARATAGAGQQQLQQSQNLRVQEQLAARQQLAQALQQQQGADISQLQFAGQQSASLLGQELAGRQAQQTAASQGEILKVEQELGEKGATLQRDIANQLTRAQSKAAFGSALGSIGGAIAGNFLLPGAGGAIGAQIGGQLGGQAARAYNKGGQVKNQKQKNVKIQAPEKMDKDTKFGFQKALQSNTGSESKYSGGGKAGSGSKKLPEGVERFTGDNPPQMSAEAQKAYAKERRDKAFKIKNIEEDVAKTRGLRQGQEAAVAQTAAQAAQSRQAQSALAQSLASGNQPSLANAQLKQQGEQSLAAQLGAANSGKRAVAPEQLQQALLNAQQQQAGNIAQQAAQLAAQEQMQTSQLGTNVTQGLRAGDINQQQFATQLANQQLAQQMGISQAQQGAAAARESLDVDRMAALQAMAAQRDAANAQTKGGGGIFSIFKNQGGKIYESAQGSKVPGEAPKKGDHLENDIVPAMLSPGEIVIPRTVVDKGEKSMIGFIKGLQAMESESKKMSKGGKAKNYANGGQASAGFESLEDMNNQMSDLEAMGVAQQSPGMSGASKAQLGGVIASQAMGILGAKDKAKRDQAAQEQVQAQRDFQMALSRIKGRRNYAKGGKVESGSYGMLLQARNDLDKKLKDIDNKKKKR